MQPSFLKKEKSPGGRKEFKMMKKESKKLHSSISVFSFGKDKTKNQMKINKKVLVLGLVLLSLIVINLVLVAAQNEPSEGDNFFQRWMKSALTGADSKIMLVIIMFVIIFALTSSMYEKGYGIPLLISIPISIILVGFVTPESILGVFRNYDALPLLTATILPMLALFLLTYLSVQKANRTLMGMQLLFWWLFTFFIVMKFSLAIGDYFELFPQKFLDGLHTYMSLPSNAPTGGDSFWAWTSLIAQGVIGLIMSIGNGAFLNFAMQKTLGTDQALATKSIASMKTAMHGLKELSKEISS